jgi:tetratricopeptide (TPR) repeat protein
MNLRLDRHSRFAISAVNLLVIAVLSCAAQTAVVGMSSLASSKLREAMNERDPERKLQLLLEAKPLFTDPESKYSTLYPNLLGAYLGVSDLNDAAKVVDEMSKAGVSELTEADSRLRLASAYINAKQYDPALQQLTPTIARLKSANSKPTAASKIQQDLVTALALEGGSLLETGSAQKALQALNESEDLRKTRHMDPSANTTRDIARCYAALGKQDDAIENFGQAYILAAHRFKAIQRHIDIAGPAASTEFTSELAALPDLILRIEAEIRPVYGSRDSQVPLQTFLKDKLTAFDEALITDAIDKAKSNKPAPEFNLSSVA